MALIGFLAALVIRRSQSCHQRALAPRNVARELRGDGIGAAMGKGVAETADVDEMSQGAGARPHFEAGIA